MAFKGLPDNIAGFVLKPGSTNLKIRTLLENELRDKRFVIIDTHKKILNELEIEQLHCVKGSWKYDSAKYKQYMMKDETIGYLVKHEFLHSNNLFAFCKRLRGRSYEAYNCDENTLRKKIHNILNKREPYENYLHVTDSIEELNAFIKIYFPGRYL